MTGDDLEEIVRDRNRNTRKNGRDYMNAIVDIVTNKSYWVDTTASWIYWTPVMSVSETVSGLELEEVAKSRAIGLGVSAVLGRPYGKFRQYWADLWHADAESSRSKKFIVDTTALTVFQIPVYGTMLYFAGASLKEGAAAFAIGLVIGA